MVSFDPPVKRYKDRWNNWMDKDETLVRLRNKLLSIGGEEVVPQLEPDSARLFRDGDILNPSGTVLRKMEDSQCHRNARYLYLNDESVTDIGTGWALSDDGLWRQHSWGMRGSELVETTEPREEYFGIILSGNQLDEFLRRNI